MSHDTNALDRRRFLKTTAAGLGAAAVGASTLRAADPKTPGDAAPPAGPREKDLIWRSRSPEMEYRRLGRTNFMCSRVVAGNGGDNPMRRRMLQSGLNYFDTGRHYGNHEVDLKDFLAKHRDQLWVTSKASGVAGWDKIHDDVRAPYLAAMKAYLDDKVYADLMTEYDNPQIKPPQDLLRFHIAAVEKQKRATGKVPDLGPVGKRMAELYAQKLDESLSRMGIDHVDCYMMHGIEIPWIFGCHEIWEAYEKAHKAGKVRHFGFSVHKHHKPVLAAGVEANAKGPWKIDLIMPGVNPESFDELRPELEAFKKQDVGIIAMKTSGIKNRPVDGREKKFEQLLGGKEYNEYERAKLWVLHLTDGLIDACIARMDNNENMERDLPLPMVKLTAAARRELRAIVKYEMSGACHLCGQCETNCPEHIALADVIRYNAYAVQYNDITLAREEYRRLGYDPAEVCTNCGLCADACPAGVPITRILRQASRRLA